MVERRLEEIMILNREVGENVQDVVYLPLQVGTDTKGNEFILSDYNKSGESHRSPFTNEYVPPAHGHMPSRRLREMELMANKGFQTYLRHYFDYGVISVYCWDLDNGDDFALGVFIRKEVEPIEGAMIKGRISCSDVVEVKKKKGKVHTYHLTSSVVLSLRFPVKVGDSAVLGGSIANDKEIEDKADTSMEHLVTIGKLIEGNSDRVVSEMRGIYVSKMREILSFMRCDAGFNPSKMAPEVLAKLG
jgi:capping protein beta